MMVSRRAVAWILFALVSSAYPISRFVEPAAAQSVPAGREQIAVFSACDQAADAARQVEASANAWFAERRAPFKVLQREMFTAPCPGYNEYGSVAITVAIHYQP